MLLPSSLSARWEEEYTVRMQLQERVHELQEVRAPHRLGLPQSPPVPLGPGAGSWSLLPRLDLPPTLAVPLTPGFLLAVGSPGG